MQNTILYIYKYRFRYEPNFKLTLRYFFLSIKIIKNKKIKQYANTIKSQLYPGYYCFVIIIIIVINKYTM